MANFGSFTGLITSIQNFGAPGEPRAGCTKLISLHDPAGGIVNFVVTPATYFVDHTMVTTGDRVTGFYDANAPTPYIYPPQLQAVVMAKTSASQNVKVDRFDQLLVSSDGGLKLNLAPATQIRLENGQFFSGDLAGRELIVVYGATTRSIPAQTTPQQVIVIC
jgi:hypothetical protein